MLKLKEWKKLFYANSNQNRAMVAALISDKIGFKSERLQVTRSLLLKCSIQEKYIPITSICTSNNGPIKIYEAKLTELKGEIDCSTLIVGDFNTPL